MKKSFSVVLTLLFLSIFSVTAFAVDTVPEVTFNGKTEYFSYENVENAPNGNPKLFFGFQQAIPGDRFSQKIEFKTKNIKGKTVKIYLRSENSNQDYDEIMKSVDFKVFCGDEEISAGKLSDGIQLGTFSGNGTTDLKVEFSIPAEVDNRISSLYGTIDWVFLAEVLDGGSNAPGTGETTKVVIWIIIAVCSIVSIFLVLILKIKTKKKK